MLQNIKVKQDQLFLTAYTLWLVDALLSVSLWNNIATVRSVGNFLQQLAYLLLIVQFLSKKTYTKRDAVGVIMIAGTAVIAYHSVYNNTFLSAMIFIYFAAEVDFKKILKQTIIVQSAFMVVTICGAVFGVIENRFWDMGNGRLRYALGYNYCSYSAHILLFITLSWVSLRETITIAETVILLGINTVLYAYTDARTDYFLCIAALAGYTIIKLKYKMKKQPDFMLLNFAAKYGCGLVTVFSVLLHALYNPNSAVWVKLNDWLTGRLNLGYQAIHEYGFSLFGKAIQWYGMGSLLKDQTVEYNYVDCAYLKLLLEAGAVIVLAMMIGFYLAGRRLIEERRYYLIWSLVVAFGYGILNVHITMVTFCCFVMVLSVLFKRQKSDTETDIVAAFGSWSRTHLSDRVRSGIRVGLILTILVLVTVLQIQGYDYIIEYDAMYRYIVGLLLLGLAACTWEGQASQKSKKPLLTYALGTFVFVAMISDFFVAGQFQYAAFSMLLFGYIFFGAWRSMENPKRLVADFKLSYKIYFIVSVLLCVVLRPMTTGKCYNGLFSNPSDQAVAMLVAYILYMVGVLDAGWGMLNVIGSMLAFYFIYRSGQPIILFIAALVTLPYLIRKIYLIGKERQLGRLIWMLSGFLAGGVLVWIMQGLLLEYTSGFGVTLVYVNEQSERFKFGIMSLFTAAPWSKLINSMCSNYCKHIKKLNFMGHKFLKKIKKVPAWSPSSIITNAYRYGVVAGVAYVGVLSAYFKESIKGFFSQDNMEMAALGCAMILCSMVAVVELPFLHIGWLVFYFVIGSFVVQRSKKDIV